MVNTKPNSTMYDESKLASPPTVVMNSGIVTLPHRNFDGRGGSGWRTTIEDFYKLGYFFMHGSYEGVSILNQTSIDLMVTDHIDYTGLGFFTDFRGYTAGRISNPNQEHPHVPSLVCYAVIYFDD